MDVEFKISKDELVAFHMKHAVETTVYKYQIIGYNIYYFLILIFILFFVRDTLYIIVGSIGWLVLFLFRKKIFTNGLRKKFFKIYSFDKYLNLFQLTHLSVTEDGLKTSTKFSEKIYKWAAIKSVNLVEQYILIRTVTNEDLLISIFSFNPIDNKEIFLDTISKNIELELQTGYPKDIKYLSM